MKNALFLLLFISTIAVGSAQALPRNGWFGARMAANESTENNPASGLKIIEVVGGTALKNKLQAGDILVRFNNATVTNMASLVSELGKTHEGDRVPIELVRVDQKLAMKIDIVGRAREKDQNSTVIYDRVAFKGGYLSVIINKPNGSGKFPALLFIPGYTCSSIDGLTPDHPYGHIVQAFSEAGFVVVRVEKSGLGDSQNTPDCSSTTLLDEVESFQAGLSKLQSLAYVDTEKICLFGHSMGGVIAPALAAKNNIRGTIVYGTTAKSWFEYQLEMNRLQLKLAKTPPLEYEQLCRKQGEIAHAYFIENKSLKDIAANPAFAEILKTDWQYDGKNMIFERNEAYWRQIQDYPVLENWKNTTGKVLVLFGESDFQAFSKADHEQIVYTVNHYHPNAATLICFPETDHYLAKSGSMQQAYDLFSQGKIQELFNLFNPLVTQKSVEWAKKILEP